MLGTDETTGGGMWTVANSYIKSELYNNTVSLKYIPMYVVGSKFKRTMFALWGYIRIIGHLLFKRPDILHVHMSEKGSVFRKGIAITIAKVFNCKIVIHMHGAEFQTWYETIGEKRKKIVSSIINKADKVIILGHYWMNFMKTLIPKEKIEVVYNAVNVPKSNKYNNNASDILFFGVVGKRKGAYDLLEAFNMVQDKIPKTIRLLFYGPDFDKKIVEMIQEKNLQQQAKYMGWLNSNEKENVFKNVLCNVLPSYNEGLPMGILETMSYGIPNISTKIAAIPEVITENNGLLIEPGDVYAIADALILMCLNNKKRQEFSDNAYCTIANHFSIEKHIEEVLRIYKAFF